jgi:DNA repair protein RadA/Sms
MGKVRRLFVCSTCERPSAQWSGRCSSCGEWGTVTEHPVGTAGGGRGGTPVAVQPLDLARSVEEHRIRTGFQGVDRVLGGGLVPGSVVLLAGAPGIGKSTLLLQLASGLSAAGHPCLLASGEEARDQVAARARRLGVPTDGLAYVGGRDLSQVVATALMQRPAVLIVDSVQTIRDQSSDALPGGVAQVRACADALSSLAKEQDITVLLVGHVTKDGDLAGPRTLEHAVDAVVTFEGDHRSGLRLLAGGKNRFGPEGELAWYEMTSAGLVETDTGPRIGEGRAEAGCATALALAGRRAFAVELQALVIPSKGPPRRQVAGLDPRRFQILAAVADRALGLGLMSSELFGASSGGLRLDDPGADLAVAAALASAGSGRPPPNGVAFVGEVSLTGSIRAVGGMEARMNAAAAAGVQVVVMPAAGSEVGPGGAWGTPSGGSADAGSPGAGVRTVRAGHVREALSWAALSLPD